jgi:hypothetical protein
MWVYWMEQCDYCVNKYDKDEKLCKYYEPLQKYMKDLCAVESILPVYGTLAFKCDYNVIDEELYYKKNPPCNIG